MWPVARLRGNGEIAVYIVGAGAAGSLVVSADFKSVPALRRQRWVGSIPTRSRHFYNIIAIYGLTMMAKCRKPFVFVDNEVPKPFGAKGIHRKTTL